MLFGCYPDDTRTNIAFLKDQVKAIEHRFARNRTKATPLEWVAAQSQSGILSVLIGIAHQLIADAGWAHLAGAAWWV